MATLNLGTRKTQSSTHPVTGTSLVSVAMLRLKKGIALMGLISLIVIL